MVKRGAAAVSGAVKRAKAPAQDADPLLEKCGLVYRAIEASANLPKDTNAMLQSVLPLCLGVPQAERHEYVQSVTKMIADELAKIEAMYQDGVAREESAAGSAEEERQRLKTVRAELEADRDGKAAALQAKKSELAQEARMFQSAKRAHEDAEARQASGEAEAAAVWFRRADLESISQHLLQPLKEGTADEAEAPELARQLGERLQGLIPLSDTLAATIPSVLGKAPGARGPFDTLAVQQLEGDVSRNLEELGAAVCGAAVARSERAEEVRLAGEAFEAAQDRQNTSAAAFTAAQKEAEDVDSLIKEVSDRIKALNSVKCGASQKVKAAQDKLAAFRGGPLSTFAELCGRGQNCAEDGSAMAPADDEPRPGAPEAGAPAQDAPAPPDAGEAAVPVQA